MLILLRSKLRMHIIHSGKKKERKMKKVDTVSILRQSLNALIYVASFAVKKLICLHLTWSLEKGIRSSNDCLTKSYESINDAVTTRTLAAGRTRAPMETFLFVFEILMTDIKLQNARAIETLSSWFAVSLKVSMSNQSHAIADSRKIQSNHRWPRSGYSWWRSVSPAPHASSFSYSATTRNSL